MLWWRARSWRAARAVGGANLGAVVRAAAEAQRCPAVAAAQAQR